ncbi:MAG TPA: hypothetical protein VJ205_02325, partial [Gammaproteobacteria bacterium]|nr:hypothetical protein [Gammaproteobacteria bacterium]
QKPCPIIQYSEKQLPTHWPALFEKLNGGQNILLHLKDTKNVYEKVVNHLFTLVQEKWVLENVWPNLDEVKGCLHNILSENVTALKEALDLLKEYYDKTEQDAELYGQRGGAGEILKSMRAQDNALERQQSTLFKLTKRWQAHQARHTFLNKYFKWIPGRKKKQVAFSKKIIEACEANHLLDDLKETLPLSEKLTTKIRQLKVQRAKIHRDIVTISDVLTAREGAKHRFLCHLQKYLPDSVSFHQNWIKLSFFETFSVLQSLMGQRLLALAYYYYLTSFLIDWKKAGTLDLDSILVQTLSQGMLTSLSNAASQKEVMFDLALIDEAQNKLPMRPTGWLAKSRLAIFLGDDTRPILVPPTTPFLDDFDAKFFALADTEEELEDLQLQGMLATTGCAFEVAKKRSYFQELDPLGEGVGPALTLRPASRVHPFLVSVVNDDILSTTESSHKENQPSTGIPIMGYCHVRGQIQKKAGTFLNPVEAFCVASWLFENKDSLRDKTVCVVTPFVQQKDLIEIYCKNNDVRCVVKLCTQLTDQKFDLVIFSAVYTLVCPKPYLFDEVPGLLKTLILSAKNHFLVFGQMDIFDPFTHTASGHFAKKLYQYGTPILPPQRLVPEEYFSRARNGLQRLQNIAQHQAHLTEILRSGKDIHIASFKVSEKDLVTLLEKVSLEEAPKISIYLGMNWPNASTKNYSASIEDLLKRLVAHGVRIHLVRGLHSNALWGDEKTFTEGYGPWLALGADPKEGAPMISLSYPEPLALQRIKDFKDYLTAHTIRAYM